MTTTKRTPDGHKSIAMIRAERDELKAERDELYKLLKWADGELRNPSGNYTPMRNARWKT